MPSALNVPSPRSPFGQVSWCIGVKNSAFTSSYVNGTSPASRSGPLVEAQAPSDWRAAAFILEQRFQDRWKKRETVDEAVTVKLDEELERRLLRCRELNAKGLKP